MPPAALRLLAGLLIAAAWSPTRALAQQSSGRSSSSSFSFAGGRLPDPAPVLRLHNTFRALHVAAPLSWDEALARQAQQWADKCDWRHADPTKSEKPRDQGENMYWSLRYAQHESGSRAVKAWYREVADVDWRASMDRRAREPGRMVGHATQLLWRSTSKVGCGYAQCSKLSGSPAAGGAADGRQADFVVCRYWPTGNYLGRMEREVMPGKLGGPEVG
jgi:hypothetical protein